MSSNTYIQVSNNRFVSANTHPILGDYITKHKPIQQRYMFVYKIICKPTGEVYFGQHVCQPNVKNPYNDHYKGSGHILQQRKINMIGIRILNFIYLNFVKLVAIWTNSNKN